MKCIKKWAICLTLLGYACSAMAQINVEHVISIGRNALYFDDYVVAIGYFNRAIDARPWMAEPYLYRSIAKISLEDYRGAAEDASLCIERNPFLSRAYLVRGVARQNLEETTAAIEDYRAGLRLSPDHADMRHKLTIALLSAQRYDEAETETLETLRLNPRHRDVYALRAAIALERGDTLQAMTRIDEALRRDSLMSVPYRLRAAIAADRSDWSTGIHSLTKVIELEPQPSADLYTNRAIMHYHANDLHAAMADYTTALGIDRKHRIGLNNRALLRQMVGEIAEAIIDWDALIALEPANYIARYNRALLLYRAGTRTKDAIADLDALLEQYPSFQDGFILRRELHLRQGNRRAAERDHWHAFDLETDPAYQAKAKARALAQRDIRTRASEDVSIDKFGLLVEAAITPIDETPKYSSAVRGRVQDGQIHIEPQPQAYLSYYTPLQADGKPASGALLFAPLVEQFNKASGSTRPISLQTTLQTLSGEQIDDISAELRQIGDAAGSLPALRRGIAYIQLQDYEQAIAELSRAIADDANNALAYFARALATARYREAEADRTRSTASETSAETQLIRGQIQTTALSSPLPGSIRPLDTLPSAQQDLSVVTTLAPEFAYGYYNRAYLYALSGERERAIADYTRAIELMPRFGQAYFNRGLLRIQAGDVSAATADLSRAGELGIYQAYGIIKQLRR